MNYIVVAHKREARAIFSAFTCKKERYKGLDIYSHKRFNLTICGNGMGEAKKNTALFLERYAITPEDRLLNFGICGAPTSYELYQFIEIGTIKYRQNIVSLHVDKPEVLQSVDTPQYSGCDTLVDMEAYAIFEASRAHFLPTQMHFYKIVSDHCSGAISKEAIELAIDSNSHNIKGVI